MRVYCGVDFHARMHTVCWSDPANGEIKTKELHHQRDDVRGFYAQLRGEVIVGVEASGYSHWFEEMLQQLGHQVWLGNAAEIRRRAGRRQKNDRRDAQVILEVLLRGEFPRVHRPSAQSREILRQLRARHKLVKMRTMVKNSLQALAITVGLPLRQRLLTQAGQQQLNAVPMSPVMSQQRQQWLSLLQELERRIAPIEDWLAEQAEADPQVQRLQTHPGIGLLTSLAVVHTLGPVERFQSSRKVTAYVGLDPREESSAERRRYKGISKAGSRLLRFLLCEAGQAAIREDQELRRFYYRISFRQGHQKAKGAVARKLLVRSYIMLREEIDYAEFLRRGVEARLARD